MLLWLMAAAVGAGLLPCCVGSDAFALWHWPAVWVQVRSFAVCGSYMISRESDDESKFFEFVQAPSMALTVQHNTSGGCTDVYLCFGF